MKQRIQGFIVGIIVCSLFSGTIAQAAEGLWKEIFYGVKVEIDGVPQTFANDMTPFIMDGRTFLPLRAIGEALGKPVEWDGVTGTVYVGKKPGGGSFVSAVPPYDGKYRNLGASVTMGGNIYHNAISYYAGDYTLHNLNGQYSSITAYIGHIDGTTGDKKYTTYSFYGDGKLIATYDMNHQDLPKQISLDVRGVLQLKIVIPDTWSGSGIWAFADAKIE